MKITKFSINRPITIMMFFILIIATGIISFIRLPVEFLPDMGFPQLTIITNYENASPEEIEEMISNKIESAVSVLKDIKEVKSISRDEISIITLKYNWGTEMEYASLQLREKLDNLRYSLPDEAERPNIVHLDPSEEPVMYISLSKENIDSIAEIQDTAENYIKKRLQQLEGVASADIIGSLEEEVEIILDESKVNSLKLSFETISSQIQNSNFKIPGGQIQEGTYKFNISIAGEFESTEDIGATPVKYTANGNVIQLRDIATINYGYKDESNITRLNQKRSLGILIRKEANANTVNVCKIVRNSLDELSERFPELSFYVSVDQSQFIRESIKSVLEAILMGGLLAFIVLYLFLSDMKSPIQIAIVIPIAVLTTFIFMFFGHISLNIISLSGLALGVGMLVDNSIVVSENIFRHREEGKNWIQAAYAGTSEVGLAIVASTLTTLAVFLPVIYVKGIAASLFKQQALTVTFSLLASLLVSITLLPMLASLRYSKEKEKKAKFTIRKFKPKRKWFLPLYWLLLIVYIPIFIIRIVINLLIIIYNSVTKILEFSMKKFFNSFQKIFEKFQNSYKKLLIACLKNRLVTMILFIALFAGSIFILGKQNKEFFPSFEQSYFTILLKLDPGTSLNSTDQITQRIENLLKNDERVTDYFTSVGKSNEDKLSYYLENSGTEHLTEIKVNIDSNYKSDDVMNDLRNYTSSIPGKITFQRGSNALLSFLDFGSSGLVVRVYGNRFEKMKEVSKEILSEIKVNNEFFDINTDFEDLQPYINLRLKRDAMSLYNVSERTISNTLKTYVSGEKISDYYRFEDQIDITLRSVSKLNLKTLLNKVVISNGKSYPLRTFIDASYEEMLSSIEHRNQYRTFSISMKYKGKIQDVTEKLNSIVAKAKIGNEELAIKVEGMNKEIDESLKSLMFALLFAIALVYMILASQFESFLLPFIIMFSAPMGAIGVALALVLTGTSVSVMSTLGMIILAGIIVNDAILLVDYTNQQHKKGMKVYDAILDAAQTRLRPILMTTLTTVLGLLPLSLGLGSGAELQSAMAITVIGGMLSATFLTLIFIPVLYSLVKK